MFVCYLFVQQPRLSEYFQMPTAEEWDAIESQVELRAFYWHFKDWVQILIVCVECLRFLFYMFEVLCLIVCT